MKNLNQFDEVMYYINNPCLDRSKKSTKQKLIKYLTKNLKITTKVLLENIS